jgi:hypothetical protein
MKESTPTAPPKPANASAISNLLQATPAARHRERNHLIVLPNLTPYPWRYCWKTANHLDIIDRSGLEHLLAK